MGRESDRVIREGSLSTWSMNRHLNDVGEQALRIILGKSVPAGWKSKGRGPARDEWTANRRGGRETQWMGGSQAIGGCRPWEGFLIVSQVKHVLLKGFE